MRKLTARLNVHPFCQRYQDISGKYSVEIQAKTMLNEAQSGECRVFGREFMCGHGNECYMAT